MQDEGCRQASCRTYRYWILEAAVCSVKGGEGPCSAAALKAARRHAGTRPSIRLMVRCCWSSELKERPAGCVWPEVSPAGFVQQVAPRRGDHECGVREDAVHHLGLGVRVRGWVGRVRGSGWWIMDPVWIMDHLGQCTFPHVVDHGSCVGYVQGLTWLQHSIQYALSSTRAQPMKTNENMAPDTTTARQRAAIQA